MGDWLYFAGLILAMLLFLGLLLLGGEWFKNMDERSRPVRRSFRKWPSEGRNRAEEGEQNGKPDSNP